MRSIKSRDIFSKKTKHFYFIVTMVYFLFQYHLSKTGRPNSQKEFRSKDNWVVQKIKSTFDKNLRHSLYNTKYYNTLVNNLIMLQNPFSWQYPALTSYILLLFILESLYHHIEIMVCLHGNILLLGTEQRPGRNSLSCVNMVNGTIFIWS